MFVSLSLHILIRNLWENVSNIPDYSFDLACTNESQIPVIMDFGLQCDIKCSQEYI